jgi:PAS domain S-box-containing protein
MIFRKKTAVDSLAPELVARVLETLDALVVVLDPEGRILLFNRKCQDLTGYKESDVKGRLMWDLLVPERVRPDARKYFTELTSGHFSAAHVIPWLTRDGRERAVSWMSSTVPDRKGKLAWVITTGIDTTEHHGQRDELQRMVSIASYDPAPALVLDRQGHVVYCNPATQNALGKGRLAGEIWKKVCPGLSDPAYDRFLRSTSPQNYTSEAKLGNRTCVFEHVSVPDQGMVLVYGFDATELRAAQAKIAEAEGAFKEFAESAAVGFYLTDAKGVFLACNQAFERQFGYRHSELTGKNISKLKLFPRRMVSVLQGNAGKFTSGKGLGFEEFEMLRKDGKHVTVAIATTPVKRAGKVELMNVVADAGDRKRLEKELARCQEQLKEADAELKERIELTSELLDKQARSASALTPRVAQRIRSLTGIIRNSAYSLELLAGAGSETLAQKQLETISGTLEQLERIGEGEPPAPETAPAVPEPMPVEPETEPAPAEAAEPQPSPPEAAEPESPVEPLPQPPLPDAEAPALAHESVPAAETPEPAESAGQTTDAASEPAAVESPPAETREEVDRDEGGL